ncbi:TAXI family TRAP transporter solute-binding subunit [Halalkalibacter alkalisediminis]|uniref:TAXI family TRAP transporter solute-binding subunit n=1 Tax=Halalkalibacter alkalisediminis TaxID=935616 RepID=A0ABV6NF01_9BACI|nr:TAXI family TRAP transporter solute-binding subunit [Halalkalibacter alkalisediminis]
MKKFFKRSLMTAVASLGLVVATACGGSDTSAPADNGDTGADSDTEVTVEYQDAPSTVVIGTASQGGVYYIYGGGLGQLLESKLGVSANVEVTGGPVDNIRLIQAGDQDLGMMTTGPGYEAINGVGSEFEGNPHDDIRVVFPMYYTPFHWWALDSSGVASLDDMAEKGISRSGVGPMGGTSGTYLPLIHELLGLDVTPVYAGAGDMTSQQQDGQLDVIGFAAGLPIPAVQEVAALRDINLFGVEGEQRDQIIEQFPFFTPYTIEAGTYENIDHDDIETIAQFNFGIVHKTMNIDFVYELVKAYHENNDLLVTTHSSATEAVPEAILLNESVPLHPGAIKYYEEIGIELPESVYPAEYQN